MRRRRKKQTVVEEIKRIKGLKTKLILTLVGIVIVGIIVVLFIAILGSNAQKIIDQYNSVSGKPNDSKYNFASKYLILSYDEKGNLKIELALLGSGNDSKVEVPDTGMDVTPGEGDVTPGPGSGDPSGPQPEIEFNGDMYQLLIDHGINSNKAKTLALIYNTLKNAGYEQNLILGMMGCSMCEGNIDQVEGAFAAYGSSFGFNYPSGKSGIIKTWEDVEYLLNWTIENDTKVTCTDGKSVYKGSCGVGAAQWSFGRRITFLKQIPAGTTPTYDVLAQATANMYLTELRGGFSDIPPGCVGKNAYDSGYYCAVEYEMGGRDWPDAKKRAQWADTIYNWMKDAGMTN